MQGLVGSITTAGNIGCMYCLVMGSSFSWFLLLLMIKRVAHNMVAVDF